MIFIAIVCTQNDELFNSYKDKAAFRKVIFHIKDIFKDHWNNPLNEYPNFYIRETVFYNIKRLIKYKTPALFFDVFKCKKCDKEKISFHTCKSRMCFFVVTNTIMNVLLLFFLNYLNLDTATLFGLFLKNLEIISVKTEKN